MRQWLHLAPGLLAFGLAYLRPLGATLERRGLLDNEAVNCLATLSGAWAAAWVSTSRVAISWL